MKLVILLLATVLTVVTASNYSAIQQFAAGNRKFTANLYREIIKKQPNENLIFSPFSIEAILALTREGAKGRTEQQLTAGLNLPNKQETGEALKQILSSFLSSSEDESLELRTANKIYLQENYDIFDSFKRIAASPAYQAGIDRINFGAAIQAAKTINDWVEAQTNNKIKNLISPDSLDATTRLVLINALYFSGKWETPFETHLTRKEKFYTSRTQHKEVDMMTVEDTFKYYESSQFNLKCLELPYLGKGGNMSMVIVLPNDKEGLTLLENNIEDVLSINPENFSLQRVAVQLPKFTSETSLGLVPILKNLGITDIFSNGADLTGISPEGLKVDEVVQKAFINVTESGTEAAAATAVLMVESALDYEDNDKKLFTADHPFIYAIKYDNVILFSGTIKVC